VNKYIKLTIGGAISAIGIYFAFKGENFGELIHQIKEVNITAFTIGCFILLSSCIVRAYRWKLIMDPVEKIPLHDVFAATMVGYFGNGILAFRLGELLRAYSVTAGRKMSTTQAFGTVILERILDLLMVIVLFIIVIPWFPFDHSGIRFAFYIFSGLTFVLIVGVFLSSKYNLMERIGKMDLFQKGIGQKIFFICDKVFDGVTLIKKTNHFSIIMASSVFLWSFYFVATYYLLNACGIPQDLVSTGIILVLGSIAIGIPALPGSAGTYDAGIKFSLIVVFGIASDQALTYAIVSHAASYFPFVFVGAVYFLLGSVSLKDVKKDSLAP
jgi:hypothetical protein